MCFLLHPSSEVQALKEMDVIETSTSHCYCYHQRPQTEWESLWSA